MPTIIVKQFDNILYRQHRFLENFLYLISIYQILKNIMMWMFVVVVHSHCHDFDSCKRLWWEFLFRVMIEYMLASICFLWNLVLSKTLFSWKKKYLISLENCLIQFQLNLPQMEMIQYYYYKYFYYVYCIFCGMQRDEDHFIHAISLSFNEIMFFSQHNCKPYSRYVVHFFGTLELTVLSSR